MKVTDKKAAIEKQIDQLSKQLKIIESSPAFKKENAIKRALATLIKKHSCTKQDLIKLLQSDEPAFLGRENKAATASRKKRKLKVFQNPKTGETVETRGGNHKILKAWKAEYGFNSLDHWLIETKN